MCEEAVTNSHFGSRNFFNYTPFFSSALNAHRKVQLHTASTVHTYKGHLVRHTPYHFDELADYAFQLARLKTNLYMFQKQRLKAKPIQRYGAYWI